MYTDYSTNERAAVWVSDHTYFAEMPPSVRSSANKRKNLMNWRRATSIVQLASASRASFDERVHLRVCNLPGQQCSAAVILFQCGKEMLQSGHQSPVSRYQQIAVTSSRNTGKTTGMRNMVTKVLKLLFEHSGRTLHS